jgi:RNA polymerase sigma factor (sigma-70 family)
MNGTDLLAEFRATRAEAAFSELVRRHTNLVYSIAKRRVVDVTLAQEVTQIVFIRLAKAPPKLDLEAQLLAWLHRTTVHVSIDLWRSETRRRAREQHAVAMALGNGGPIQHHNSRVAVHPNSFLGQAAKRALNGCGRHRRNTAQRVAGIQQRKPAWLRLGGRLTSLGRIANSGVVTGHHNVSVAAMASN